MEGGDNNEDNKDPEEQVGNALEQTNLDTQAL